MSQKKYRGLTDALSGRRQEAPESPVDAEPPVAPLADQAPSKGKQQKSRIGRVGYTVWLKPEMRKQIKLTAVELDCTEQTLCEDAMNNLFEVLGKKRIE